LIYVTVCLKNLFNHDGTQNSTRQVNDAQSDKRGINANSVTNKQMRRHKAIFLNMKYS